MALTTTEEAQTRELLAKQAALLSLAGNETTITSKLGAAKVNLSQLPAAAALAAADIMLVRQGTTDSGISGSALKAYTSPDASDTVKGIVELATAAEVQTGTDTTRAITPAGLVSLTASATRSGLIELATNAEVQAGADTVRAVTPAGLASLAATETRAGVASVATTTEVSSGVVDTKFVSPLKLIGGMSSSFASNGFIKLPSWMGGLIFQWGTVNCAANSLTTVTLPIAFPSGFPILLLQPKDDTADVNNNPFSNGLPISLTQFRVRMYYTSALNISWFALGY